MAGNLDKSVSPGAPDVRVGACARSVIGKLVETPQELRRRRLDIVGRMAYETALDLVPKPHRQFCDDVALRKVSRDGSA